MICSSPALRHLSVSAAIALGVAALGSAIPAWAQTEVPQAAPAADHAQADHAQADHSATSDRASAYYNFSMGHMYAELAQAYNRQDYVNKAIDCYRLALKQDPTIGYITEELTDLYIQSGQLSKAVTEAEDLLKQQPDNLGARRILGRVYSRMIGDPSQGKLDEKMLHLAIEQYAIVAAKDPDDSESSLLLARLYRLNKDNAAAEKIYQAVLARESDNEEALTSLAAIYSDRGDTKNAIQMLKRATEGNPSPRALAALASLYEQVNDFPSAADAWSHALQLAPDNDRWKRQLGTDLMFSNRLEDAKKLYEEIALGSPQDAQVQLRLSEIYLQQRDFAKARAALNVAKQSAADDQDVRFEEVLLLAAEEKSDDAIKAMKALLDSTAKPEYSASERVQRNRYEERLGILYRVAGKYPQAIATFREITSDDPEFEAGSALEVIETYRQAKDLPAARREAEAAMKKFPKDRAVILAHATLLADSGKVDQAVTEVMSLKDGKNDRDLLLATAQLYEKAKRYTDEEKVLDEAEKMSDNKTDIRFMRGALLEKMKNFEAAEAEFRKVLQDEPTNAGALNYLGYMLADRNARLEEAQQLISKALEIDPQNGAYLDSLGWVYYRQNRLDAAEDQLRRALDKMGNDPTVHDHLGDVLLKRGKVKEAIAQWQSSLKHWDGNPDNPDTDQAEMAKVQRKLEDARVRIAQQSHTNEAH